MPLAPPVRAWTRALLALPAGAAVTFAFAPYFWLPALLGFAVLLWLLAPDPATPERSRSGFAKASGWRTRAAVGWSFGFGYFLAGLYWIGEAFLVDAEQFAWLRPIAMAALPVGLALFPAAAAVLAGLGRGPVRRWLTLAGAWTVVEWLRGWVLTGFPWNQAGDGWVAVPAVAQLAALAGGLGLCLLTVLAAAAPALLVQTGWRRAVPALALAWAVLAAGAGWGWQRLQMPPPDTDVRIRVVQPNVPQALKWRPEQRVAQLRTLVALSAGDGGTAAVAIVWPETATPFLFAHDDDLRQTLTRSLPAGAMLLTGAPRAVDDRNYRNSLHVADRTGRIVASYDKHHLVPFGEYVPFRPLLRRLGIERLAAGRGDFGPGPGEAVLYPPGLPPLQPLICYEVIFAGEIGGAGRPAWLLNVTNDAWFGDTPGPHQHFAIARLRAIEQGVPVVRAANTGISGVIDALGIVRQRLPLGHQGSIDAALPGVLPALPPFARYGHWPVLLLAAFLVVVGLLPSGSRAGSSQ